MGDDRTPVYYEGERLVIRASAIGHPCMWELIAAGQGVDSSGAPAFMKKAFQEGHDAESLIVKELEEKYGFLFIAGSAQKQDELLLDDELSGPYEGSIVVRYHPDGIAEVMNGFLNHIGVGLHRTYQWGEVVVVEIKNLGDDWWQRAVKSGVESTIADYPWQLSVMMINEQLPGLWVCRNKGKKVKGKKVFCADEGKYHFQFVREPLVGYQDMRLKGRAIKEGVDGEDLLTSDRPCDSPDHFPCLYRHVRPEPEEGGSMGVRGSEDVWDVPPELEEELEEALREHLLFKGQADESAARAKAATQRVVEMIPEGVKKVRTSKRTFNVADSRSNTVAWDDMSDELRRAVSNYKRSKVTGRHVRDFKRSD